MFLNPHFTKTNETKSFLHFGQEAYANIPQEYRLNGLFQPGLVALQIQTVLWNGIVHQEAKSQWAQSTDISCIVNSQAATLDV